MVLVDDPGACSSTCMVGWGGVVAEAVVVVDELLGLTGSGDDEKGPPG